MADCQVLPTAIQPGVGDSHACTWLKDGGFARSQHTLQKGTSDGYGSVLIDVGHNIDWQRIFSYKMFT